MDTCGSYDKFPVKTLTLPVVLLLVYCVNNNNNNNNNALCTPPLYTCQHGLKTRPISGSEVWNDTLYKQTVSFVNETKIKLGSTNVQF
jgi:hypothetical protein